VKAVVKELVKRRMKNVIKRWVKEKRNDFYVTGKLVSKQQINESAKDAMRPANESVKDVARWTNALVKGAMKR
jgi:hypothetical protein